MKITYKLFDNSEAKVVSNLIKRNFKEINSKDYTSEEIENYCNIFSSDYIIKHAQKTNFYVFYLDDKLVGCGAIANYFQKEDEAILLTIFVNPDYHGKKIGKEIITVLENDEVFKKAKRIEIPSSITAVGFYLKYGYDYKDGIKKLDNEKHYRLEKFN